MSSKTELIVDFAELRVLSIPCPKCQTRVRLDCGDLEANVPQECPGCGREYGESFRSGLHSFRELYRKFSGAGERPVQICIEKAE